VIRWLAVAALLVGATGCSKRCKDGTILLSVDFGSIGNIDRIDVDSAGFTGSQTITGNPRTGTIEIDFPPGAYPKGQTIALIVTAESNQAVVAIAMTSVMLSDSCEAPATLFFGTPDLGSALDGMQTPRDGMPTQTDGMQLPDLLGIDLNGVRFCKFDDNVSKFDDDGGMKCVFGF
jgi:hypothetical protein